MSDEKWEVVKAVAIVALPAVGAIVTGLITSDTDWPSSDWYKQLNKPWFTPPNWVFPPVWAALYGSMGYASYLVYRRGVSHDADVTLPLAAYGAQLLVNWTWSPLFFNCKNYGLASASILTMLGGAAASAALFYCVDPTAGQLMVPYVSWLTLASAITVYIWRNNGPPEAKYRRTFFGGHVNTATK